MMHTRKSALRRSRCSGMEIVFSLDTRYQRRDLAPQRTGPKRVHTSYNIHLMFQWITRRDWHFAIYSFPFFAESQDISKPNVHTPNAQNLAS